jgi:hypothetical protein
MLKKKKIATFFRNELAAYWLETLVAYGKHQLGTYGMPFNVAAAIFDSVVTPKLGYLSQLNKCSVYPNNHFYPGITVFFAVEIYYCHNSYSLSGFKS